MTPTPAPVLAPFASHHVLAGALAEIVSPILSPTRKRNSAPGFAGLAAAVRGLASGVTISDPALPDNPIVYANPGFQATTGYAPEEVLGRNCRFLQGPDTDPARVRELRGAIADRRPFVGVMLNRRKDGTPFWNELYVNPFFDADGRLAGFVGLQNDVTGRVEAERLLEERVRARTAELADSQVEMLSRLARAAEHRDDDTGRHTERVGRTSALLAAALGWSAERVALVGLAAPLHDVGKIGVPDSILLKPGKLTAEEFEAMKSHVTKGVEMLAGGGSEVVRMAETIAGSHHERWDGTGYPAGLAAEAIPQEGRVAAVADVFDALTHDRPYKKAWPVAEAVAEVARQSGRHFDPAVVAAFLTLPHGDLV